MKGKFTCPVSCGTANAIRRALLEDIPAWAPYKLNVSKNTTCQTDEFIAHRIGLIPFRRIGNGDEMTIHVKGRTLRASDLIGPAFEPVYDLDIMDMNHEQEFKAVVLFDENVGSKHARYKMCAGVGMKELKHNMYEIVFETIDDQEPIHVLQKALDKLDGRIDHGLKLLSN